MVSQLAASSGAIATVAVGRLQIIKHRSTEAGRTLFVYISILGDSEQTTTMTTTDNDDIGRRAPVAHLCVPSTPVYYTIYLSASVQRMQQQQVLECCLPPRKCVSPCERPACA